MKNIKKILYIFLIIFVIGCSNENKKNEKVLVCNNESIRENFTINEENTFHFNNDILELYKQKLVADYGSNESGAQELYNNSKELCNTLIESSGVNCVVNRNEKNEVIIELTLIFSELTKLPDDPIFGENLTDRIITYEQVKKWLEKKQLTHSCEEK